MKSILLSATLFLSTVVTHQAFAAGAATWTCISNKSELTATYEASMFGEILTTLESRANKAILSKTYFVDQSSQPAPGSKMMLEDDSQQSQLQQKSGTYAAELAEIILSTKEREKYDFGFQFQGSSFLCSRD